MTMKVYAYPFELGFLEFLYLAAFHGSLTVWLFRKKCLIVVMFVYYFLGASENWCTLFIESYSFFNLLSKIGLFNAMIKVRQV